MSIQKTADQLRADLARIASLVESAAYASAFESIGQYRTALNEFIKEITNEHRKS